MAGAELDEWFSDHEIEHNFEETTSSYIFTPIGSKTEPAARKRRKISHAGDSLKQCDDVPFVPLLDGQERRKYATSRIQLFKAGLMEREKRQEAILQEANLSTVKEVAAFLEQADLADYRKRLPTGAISAGTSGHVSTTLFDAIADYFKAERGIVIVKITAAQSSNVKSALRHIIQSIIGRYETINGYDAFAGTRSDVRMLHYDLQILYEHMQQYSVSRAVIYFQNCESFDTNVLADLIDVLSSWIDRISFMILLEVATSVPLFQEKLPRATVRKLKGTAFELAPIQETLESIFKSATSGGTQLSLWIGAGLSRSLLDRQREHLQSVRAFTQAIKYCYMTHFFANPLSIFLSLNSSSESIQPEHYEAVRNLPSFRRFINDLLENKHYNQARRLLDNDDLLHQKVTRRLGQGQKALRDLLSAINVLSEIHTFIWNKNDISWSELYVKGMSGELATSTLLRELLFSIRKLSSDAMSPLLERLSDFPVPGLSNALEELEKLTITITKDGTPLHSEHDLRHETLRTTVIAQKVELSKQRSSLSKEEAAYSKIVNQVDSALKDFFDEYLINPQELFLNEIFIYDLKSPHRDVFVPKPRFAVERALSSPHDYLGCECCRANENGLLASQPATAILYQLYLESGALINIADLWSAFHVILGGEQEDEDEGREQKISALFYRALAELKYLGMIKNSRKRTDHLVKLSWKGL